MVRQPPPSPAAIQAELAYLRTRKAALDELILCLERYYVINHLTSPPGNAYFGSMYGRSAGAA